MARTDYTFFCTAGADIKAGQVVAVWGGMAYPDVAPPGVPPRIPVGATLEFGTPLRPKGFARIPDDRPDAPTEVVVP